MVTDSADYWIEKLQLKPHAEGGFYKEIYRSEEIIRKEGLPARYDTDHSICTSIYFLLKSDQVSAFHRLKSDEIWHFYSGSSIIVYIIDAAGILSSHTLGCNIMNNEQLQLVIPCGCWFAANVVDDRSYSLVGCTVAPGFDYHDFELAKKETMIKKYPQYKELIIQMCAK
jgi:uncharacterized protein